MLACGGNARRILSTDTSLVVCLLSSSSVHQIRSLSMLASGTGESAHLPETKVAVAWMSLVDTCRRRGVAGFVFTPDIVIEKVKKCGFQNFRTCLCLKKNKHDQTIVPPECDSQQK